MRNPFGLLIKGLILAVFWWVCLSLFWTHTDGVLDQLWPRLLFCISGVVVAGLAACLILLNQREGLRLFLAPSEYWGVNVTLGRFPVTERLPAHSTSQVQSLLKVADIEQPVSKLLESQSAEIANVLQALLSYIAGCKHNNELLAEAWKTCVCMQRMAQSFNYRGLAALKIPPTDLTFRLDSKDGLIPIIAFAHTLGTLMRDGVDLDSPQSAKLSVKLLTRLAEVRSLGFDEQHVLYQVLGNYLNPEKLPVERVKDKVSIRNDRIVALIELLREAKKPGVPLPTQCDIQTHKAQPKAPEPVNILKKDDVEKLVVKPAIAESIEQIEDGCYNVLYDLLHEPFRINGSKADLRVGLLYGENVYLITDKVLEGLRSKGYDNDNAIALKQDIIDALDAKEMLYKKDNKKNFSVQFKGVIKKEEKTNNYQGMIIFAWTKKMPLLGNLGDSLFVPRILDNGVITEAVDNSSPPSETSVATPSMSLSQPKGTSKHEAEIDLDDLSEAAGVGLPHACDVVVINTPIEPSLKELTLIRRTIYDELNKLVEQNHSFVARLQDGDERWLCVSLARVDSQEVPVSVNQIALLLKHKEQVTGFRVSKNDKGSTILSFARA